MDDSEQTNEQGPATASGSEAPVPPSRPVRLPRPRWMTALAAAMLGVGVAIGAAIGPAPAASLAGDVPDLAKAIPLLISQLEAKDRASRAATTAAVPPPVAPEPTPAATSTEAAKPASATTTPASEEAPEARETGTRPKSSAKKLPAITNVWLIELDGGTLEAALAQKTAAPYIDSSLAPAATILTGWSAPQAMAFASEAVLAEPPTAGSVPPLLHTIVQPPCAEGDAACAPETPGQLTAADEFLKATLASVMSLSTYKEHGLVVIAFASVGIATQQELPAGASISTLAYQPPGGAALLSPFAKAGTSSATFDPTSPRRSLERLLR